MTELPHSPLHGSISRRTLLSGAARLAAVAVAGQPAFAQPAAQQITFAFAPDESGAIQRLIDAFNTAHRGEIEVRWRLMDRISDTFFRELQSDFLAGAADIDVFGADVIWTAELAAQDQIADLTARIAGAYPRGTFVDAAARSVYYRNRVWAVPWFTDAGMLYYRRDLLANAGFAQAPATWEELAMMAGAVQERTGISHGFVFQGDSYEGGVTNALEYIWSAGGRPWTTQVEVPGAYERGQAARSPNVVTLNSRASVAGLAMARRLVASGVAPIEVTNMRELETVELFMAGDAVFMRNWPFAYGLLTGAASTLTPDQIGIAPIPTLEAGRPSYSCLGGWNFAIPAASPRQEAAWRFIQFALQSEQQRAMARQGGFLPALSNLYDDPALREEVPVVALGEIAVRNARTRPASPIYSLLSPRLAFMFKRILQGEVEPAAAVVQTQAELQRIIQRHAY